MPSTTSNQKAIPPHHKDFHWIHGPGQEEKFVDFIALTRDDVQALLLACTSSMPVIWPMS